MHFLEKASSFISKYMAVFVIAIAAVALFEPPSFKWAAPNITMLLGYGTGFLLAKTLHMDIAKAKAVSIEVGMQNSGLATSLAMLHFGPAAAIPGAIFSVWHNISGSLAANYLSSRNSREKQEK